MFFYCLFMFETIDTIRQRILCVTRGRPQLRPRGLSEQRFCHF